MSDLAQPDVMWVSMDAGVDQTSPFTSKFREDFGKLWDRGEYFKMPTRELPGGTDFNLAETEPTLHLSTKQTGGK